MTELPWSAEHRAGRIITFYSYAGGTGRTMALANIGWILAATGKRVLVADWDLGSPGLHTFFRDIVGPDRDIVMAPGVVNFIRAFEGAVLRPIESVGPGSGHALAAGITTELIDEMIEEHIIERVVPIKRFPGMGEIHYLSPGRQEGGVYVAMVDALDWDTIYKFRGADLLERLGERLKSSYDYILIDSSAGTSEIVNICTAHLPDVVLNCFTLAGQGIDGAAKAAHRIRVQSGERVKILPVPTRIDRSRMQDVAVRLNTAEQAFAWLQSDMSADQRRRYWDEAQVPYRPDFAFEEVLAGGGNRADLGDLLFRPYERIANLIIRHSIE